jgi:hypothetical protein
MEEQCERSNCPDLTAQSHHFFLERKTSLVQGEIVTSFEVGKEERITDLA